ncbi:hypothetical protein [Paraburkholderia sp. ZP32-5]|uniref:hypothetical protein n=1 Tax=Paraburkholderia sp. ZP32-5 TaxID=2883245 RepID=UPI001F2C39EE|nr:hypothetical protein [Paraburkholderia sp. ZP32-5]
MQPNGPATQGWYSAAAAVHLSLLRSASLLAGKTAQRELNRWQAVADRFDTVKPLRAFIDEARLQPAISSSTIHGAKGDEWDHVAYSGERDHAFRRIVITDSE